MVALLTDPDAWAAFASLAALEIVLGIDNVVFISILVSRCSRRRAQQARRVGLSLAFLFRIRALLLLTWSLKLASPLFQLSGISVSWRDIVLIAGGLFLIAKATYEIHHDVEPRDTSAMSPLGSAAPSFVQIIAQLVAIDAVFSVDSIITAIGMVDRVEIMIGAVAVAMIVMYAASAPVAGFIAEHPTTKLLALAFLLLVGTALVADGVHFHVPRGYLYFSMAFASGVEALNLLAHRRRRPLARR